MFDFSTITEISLAGGPHDSPEDGLCFMEAVAWFEGEPHSDRPACACPVLGRYGIGLNDQMPDDERNRLLLPMVPLMAGTRDPESEQKRAEFLAMWAVNKIVPIALRVSGLDDHALACEGAKTLAKASAAAHAAAYAAAAYAAAAYAADAYAADATATADAAAYAAAATADAYDAYAANAAKAAADAAKATAEIWPIAVEGLRQAILIGRHDGFTHIEKLAERREALKELVG